MGTNPRFLKILFFNLILSLVSLSLIQIAYATNGLNLIGFGSESNGIGGADIAVSDDFSSMNINPAGLSRIRLREAGLSISYLKPNLDHNGFGVTTSGEDDPILLPDFGTAYRLKDSPVTIGIGLFTQGGVSTDFKDIPTPFGGTDRSSSFIRHTKITPSVAYQVSDRTSFGIAANISYLDTALRLFPNIPSGFETNDRCSDSLGLGAPGSCAWGIGYGARVGLLYAVNKVVSVGATYNSPIRFDLSDGDITFNLSGLGDVRYDAEIEGIEWPQEAGIGISVTPAKRLIVSFDIVWINWNGALNTVTINATNPDNQAAPPNITVPLKFDWRDQYVFAIGIQYMPASSLTLRGGYNFGRNPVPTETLTPLAPLIVEQHFTAGAEYALTKGVDLGLSM
ncbi:MAG TPA: outer membrane protein transport protein, partial [Nitrospiria bacterium]|nr:outer membrane protein transport protein [Nitrospiria bacterium]